MTTIVAQDAIAPSPHRLVRVLFMGLGTVLVGIGVLGIFLPLLPSTVFFLLAAGCYGKGSPTAYRWLMTNRLFGERLRDYKEERGATSATKLVTLASLWLGIGLGEWLTGFNPWISVALVLIAIAVTVHIVTLRTVRAR